MSGDEAAPVRDPVAELAMLPRTRADWVLGTLTTAQRRELHDRWEVWAHPGQHLGARTRAGTAADDWRIWVILAGRGFGKTRAGAEWVSQVARDNPGARIALVGATIEDVRRVGDATPVETRCVMRGASVVPPSPVHLRCFAEADGSATVKWTRRSRAGWRWIDGVDAPLSEEVEAYRVTVTAGGTSREVDVPAPFVAVTAAERAASASVAVRQRGIFGESLAVDLIVPA